MYEVDSNVRLFSSSLSSIFIFVSHPHFRLTSTNARGKQTFDILDAYTWRADVNSFPALDSQIAIGPTYALEYSTRDVYGANIAGWGSDDPLNATWWHLVTECASFVLVS